MQSNRCGIYRQGIHANIAGPRCQKHIFVLSDEIYDQIVFPPAVANQCHNLVLRIAGTCRRGKRAFKRVMRWQAGVSVLPQLIPDLIKK